MSDLYREPTEESPSNAVSVPLSGVEAEIAELEKQIAQKRGLLGVEKQKPLEQILGAEKPATSAPAAAAPNAPAGAIGATPPAKTKAQDLKNLEKNQQLKNLVDLAFQKGIAYAADVAREMDNPYLMDELHDTLVDNLRKELVERGKLEEI